MRTRSFSIFGALVLALVAFGVVSTAAGAPTIERTPVPMPPKPDFSSMKFLLGTWTCSTKSSRRPSAYITVTTTSMDPTGYWMIGNDNQRKTSWFPYSVTGTDKTTYDAGSHRWVDVYTDNLGGYGVATSSGWRGNNIVWTDALFVPGPDIVSETPLIVKKIGDTKTTAYSTFNEKSGRTVTVNTSCNKTG